MKARVTGLAMILFSASGDVNRLPMPLAPPAPFDSACAAPASQHGRCSGSAQVGTRLSLLDVGEARLELLVPRVDFQALLVRGQGLRAHAG